MTLLQMGDPVECKCAIKRLLYTCKFGYEFQRLPVVLPLIVASDSESRLRGWKARRPVFATARQLSMRQTLITPASLTSRIVESKIPDHLFHAPEISIICPCLSSGVLLGLAGPTSGKTWPVCGRSKRGRDGQTRLLNELRIRLRSLHVSFLELLEVLKLQWQDG